MLNRFLQEKRIQLQVYILFKTNLIVNVLQRLLRNYIKCSNQYFIVVFINQSAPTLYLFIVMYCEEIIVHLLPQEVIERNSAIVNNKLIQCLVSAYLLLHR